MNIFRVGVFNGMAVIVRALVGLTVTKLSAAVLGPAGFVVLANVQTVSTLWVGLSNGTFYNSVTRFLAEPGGSASAHRIVPTAAILALLLGCLLAPVVWLVSQAIIGAAPDGWAVQGLCLALALACPLIAVGSVLNGYFNGRQHLGQLVGGNILASVLSLCASLALIFAYGGAGALYSVVAASVAIFGGYAIVALAERLRARAATPAWRAVVDWRVARATAPYASMALASAIAAPLTLFLVRQTLVTQVGAAEAGKWQAIWRLSELYIAPLTATFSVYFLPRFASIADAARLRTELLRCAGLVLAIMAVLAAIVLLWRRELVHLLLGRSFDGAEALLPLQLVGDTLKLVSWMFGYLFLAKGATRQYIAGEMLFMVAFICATRFLVTPLGIQAPVVSYIVSYAIYLSYCVGASKRAHYL